MTPPSGSPPAKVEIKELITGTGTEANAGDTVTVNYVGVLYNGGAQFDSSWRRGKRFTFTLGTNQVIAGWDQGVPGMKVGGRRELIVPASQAYGAKGLATRPVAIPPNAALVFVVDLLAVSTPHASSPPASTPPGGTSPSTHHSPTEAEKRHLHEVEQAERESTNPVAKKRLLESEERLRRGE